jgi:folate-dependent phosphoribosylglycinamide formyltransferase PurN
MKWLLLTTGNLPEAYVMADFLLRKSQEVILFNIRGRTRHQRLQVLKRLARKRGLAYLCDLLLGRGFRSRYLDPAVRPFPEMTTDKIAELSRHCAYHEIDDPHAPETIRQVSELQPDHILFLGAPVIQPELFTLARHGALNWHHGLSPRYRGSDCVLWAMANNEFDQIGFTIHRVSAVVDGGEILLQRKVSVRKDMDFSQAVADVARQGMDGFIEVVDGLLSGPAGESRTQEKGGVHYPPIGWSAIRRARNHFQAYARR